MERKKKEKKLRPEAACQDCPRVWSRPCPNWYRNLIGRNSTTLGTCASPYLFCFFLLFPSSFLISPSSFGVRCDRSRITTADHSWGPSPRQGCSPHVVLIMTIVTGSRNRWVVLFLILCFSNPSSLQSPTQQQPDGPLLVSQSVSQSVMSRAAAGGGGTRPAFF
jgi:hypothetical protein